MKSSSLSLLREHICTIPPPIFQSFVAVNIHVVIILAVNIAAVHRFSLLHLHLQISYSRILPMAHRNPTAFASFVYRQMTASIPVPHQSFVGQTIIITGANTGLGFEAAKHVVRLGAEKVILGVRNLSKGQEAKGEIDSRTGKPGVVEVWQVDLASYDSVKAFARKAESLQRIDVVLENAGMWTEKFTMAEDNEYANARRSRVPFLIVCRASLTVNVVSTFLLALMMLPKLRESASKFGIIPRISIVSSLVHRYTNLSAKSYPKILESMNHMEQANMRTRSLAPLDRVSRVSLTRFQIHGLEVAPNIIRSTLSTCYDRWSKAKNHAQPTRSWILPFWHLF